MKTLNQTLMTLLVITFVFSIGCTKEGKQGPQGITGAVGPKGDNGPDATTYNFNLTFNAGDTYKSYGGITNYDTDDVVFFFIYYENLSGVSYWTSMPVMISNINFVPEFSDQSGYAFINTTLSNGSSPWTSTTTLSFKAVLIKSSQRLAHPDIDYTNYYEVKGAFNLKD